jgi:BirA family transcriptional regulator, biotin operon repressor / biotin---[acetyl-CoA-carboxylase] ligase
VDRLRPRAGENPLGGAVVHVDVIASTNDRARELVAAGAPHGTVVVAEEQTAGRGRQGRSWTALRGRGLTISIVVRLDPLAGELLPLSAAVAVCEACERAASVRCQVKWPNDVWIEARKVAGILIEARPQERWAVLGIGLNVDTEEGELAGEIRETATSLRIASGSPVDRTGAFDALLDRLTVWLGADRESVLSAFRERDALYGRRVSWTAGEERLDGDAAGVDENGNLVVFTPGGERLTLGAGEVHLIRENRQS